MEENESKQGKDLAQEQKKQDKIKEAINNHGGIIKIHDTIDLQLARKR